MNIKTLKMIFLPAILAFAVLTTGCSTMFGNNTRNVMVNSNPQGAAVYINNVQYATTPAMITLPNYIYGGEVLTFKKNGYQEQSSVVNTQFQWVGLLNIFNAGLGFIIDGVTGDIIEIAPANLAVTANLQANSNGQ